MSDASRFLVTHGLPIIFGVVFLEQLGLPIPSLPWLLAAGALAAVGKFHWLLGLDATIIACLMADFFWYYLGRFRGAQVLGLLCRISLEPDTCVRRTVNVFTRHGWRGIVIAKFVPGMSTITPPLAGMSGIGLGRFLLLDAVGSFLYCGVFLLLGAMFSNQIAQIGLMAERMGSILGFIAALVLAYIGWKFWQRRSLLRELSTAKITVEELGRMLDSGENPFILDMRSTNELEQDPAIIRGAIHFAANELETRLSEFPRDRDIVVYCACPNEVSSAKVALLLRRKGFSRVRPLLGGIDAWRKGNYPMGVWTKTTATTTTTVLLSKPLPAGENKEETVA